MWPPGVMSTRELAAAADARAAPATTSTKSLPTVPRLDRYGLKTKKYTQADAPNYSYLNSREGGVMRVGGRYSSTYRRLLIKRVPPQ